MKLNIAGGKLAQKVVPSAGWVWMDLHAWPTHVRADALALPFRDEAFEAVHCSHMIEHVERAQAPTLLREVRRVLSENGYAYLSAPDAARTRDIQSEYWTRMTRWGGPTPGWDHKWITNVRNLREMLNECGLVPSWATAIPSGHPPNIHGWPVDLEARFVCRRDDFKWPRKFPDGVNHI